MKEGGSQANTVACTPSLARVAGHTVLGLFQLSVALQWSTIQFGNTHTVLGYISKALYADNHITSEAPAMNEYVVTVARKHEPFLDQLNSSITTIKVLLLNPSVCPPTEFSLFSFNNGMVVSSCRELDNNRSALSAASAFAIATAGANEGTPTKEKYRRMSLASTGQ